ncbi:uncharacterized protein YjbJ (UPF0337 family) [Kitasatospora sp. MAA4]|uniref:hypothetical protein n=1 Tax=Kitasatospora sp. MAA4 TaxID=3035093 RepID=UPI0024765DA2|nr:hypothetical protein [Kitasatospora sp. MAA4]MDH6135154.1 uncharacterized protein YjbJ (UPF0337 family) [Kitasatospora sp. MAA4]
MGIFDKFREKADEAVEQAKTALGGHKDRASDAMSDTGHRASDAMGDMTGRSRESAVDPVEQAAHDMDSEGGHDPM